MSDALFAQGVLFDFLENRKKTVRVEVGSITEHELLTNDEDDVCAALTDKYHLRAPVLKADEKRIDPGDGYGTGGGRLRVWIPFEGDSVLFGYRPNEWRDSPPSAIVGAGEVGLTFDHVGTDATAIKRDIAGAIYEIGWHLERVTAEGETFNQELQTLVEGAVKRRRNEALTRANLVRSLEIPIRRRQDVPVTYSFPVRRRRPVVGSSTVPAATSPPEPSLAMADYEGILRMIASLGTCVERSPRAFAAMNEEDLRWLCLVILNAHYEGGAVGEAFSYSGKTDILISENGRSVFVAECKVWQGPASLSNAVGQLLSYLTWRDTKAAILLFSRRKSFSRVLAVVPDVLRRHSTFRRETPVPMENAFRVVLGRPDDPGQEIIVTVLAFDVPVLASPEAASSDGRQSGTTAAS